jgi:hypothetical protein
MRFYDVSVNRSVLTEANRGLTSHTEANRGLTSYKYRPVMYNIAISCCIALRCCACAALVFDKALTWVGRSLMSYVTPIFPPRMWGST